MVRQDGEREEEQERYDSGNNKLLLRLQPRPPSALIALVADHMGSTAVPLSVYI